MIPHANAARFPPSKAGVPLLVRAALAILAVLILSQYLAGFFFLWLIHLNPQAAGPLTVARYAHYYRDRADIRHRVWFASGLGLMTVAFCALPIILPRRRALHGDARFATRREIARAGLFATSGLLWGALVVGTWCCRVNKACCSPRRRAPKKARRS